MWRPWSGFQVLLGEGNESTEGELEKLGDVAHGAKGRTLLATFDLPDIAQVIAKGMGQIVLRHPTLSSQLSHSTTKRLLSISGRTFNGSSDRPRHIPIVPSSAMP